jgi:hypothetical protein
MALSSFTPSAYGSMSAPPGTSASQAIPGGDGTVLLVTNIGPAPAVVLLGGSSVAVTFSTGVAVLPNQSLALAVGSNTYIAAMGIGSSALLNLAQGV